MEGVIRSLGQMPREARTLIKILNSKTKDELADFEIADRIETILEGRRVLSKRNLLVQLENKCKHCNAPLNIIMQILLVFKLPENINL